MATNGIESRELMKLFKDFLDKRKLYNSFKLPPTTERYFELIVPQLKKATNSGECFSILDQIKEPNAKERILIEIKLFLDEIEKYIQIKKGE